MISRIIEVEVGVISRSRRLRLITLTETSIILNITKTESNNCFIIHWTEKIEVIFFASSLTPSSTKRANLTWLLLEIMHRGHTWHDYPWPWHDYSWPWHDYCIICKFWRHGRWFRKFTVGFRPIKKELESWMYNNKQLLDEVFVIFRIIEVEVGVISRSRRLRLITLPETSIILNITKTESNNCFIIHWTEKIEVIFLLLR